MKTNEKPREINENPWESMKLIQSLTFPSQERRGRVEPSHVGPRHPGGRLLQRGALVARRADEPPAAEGLAPPAALRGRGAGHRGARRGAPLAARPAAAGGAAPGRVAHELGGLSLPLHRRRDPREFK